MRIASMAFLCFAVLCASAGAQVRGPASRDAPRPAVAPKADATTTSVACYLKDGSGNIVWQWGLSEGNAWFSLTGEWQTTPYTKLKKFFTSVDGDAITAACVRSINYYYPNKGYSVMAMFAADSNAGSSYPIVANGVELSPSY